MPALRVQIPQVSEICKQVGVERPLQIWRELDSEKKGYVTLADFAPDEHRTLTKFAQELTSLAITVEGLWPKIDPNMSGRVTRYVYSKSKLERIFFQFLFF